MIIDAVYTGLVSSDIVREALLHQHQLFLDVLRRLPPASTHIQRVRDSAVQRASVHHRLVSVSLITVSFIAATHCYELPTNDIDAEF